MSGLLGDISSGLESLLGNEFVQGAGMVGALGFNPLIGLLAGPAIKSDRERRELENDVTREALKGSRSRREGADRLADLLGQSVIPAGAPLDVMDIEGGILAQTQGVPGRVPTQSQTRVPLVSTPGGQQQAFGAAVQAAPAAAVNQLMGGLLGQTNPRRQSVDARLEVGRELGLEGDELAAFAGGGGSSQNNVLDTILKGLQVQNEQAEIIERNRGIQEEQEAQTEGINRLNSAGNSVLSLETRIDALDGKGVLGNPLDLETAMGVASVLPEFLVEGATGLVGDSMSKADIQKLRDQQQEFNVFANDVLVTTAGELNQIGRSDAGRALLAGTKPNANLGTQPNISAAALAAQRILDSDPEGRMDPKVRKQLEALIKRARGGDAEREQDLNDAREALARGVPQEEVFKILRANGIDPGEL